MLQGGSDPRPGSGSGTNKQERFSNNIEIRKREASRKRSRREDGWERERFEGNQGRFCSVERAACPIHVPGEDAPAQIQIQDLAAISRSSKGAP
jgi:hypothetical protein